jgi:metal-sulfur cluster biosynthetic enzyme
MSLIAGRPLENANPEIKNKKSNNTVRSIASKQAELDDDLYDPVDSEEIFDIIREVRDPEHPLSLEALGVVSLDQVKVYDSYCQKYSDDDKTVVTTDRIEIMITPTIPHCSLATLIGLTLHCQLRRSISERFKISVKIEPGSHDQEEQINRQLNDKERVAAAMETPNLLKVINGCLTQASLKL